MTLGRSPHANGAPLTPDSLVWQEVFWPQPLPAAAATALLRHWAAQRHAPRLVLEARATKSGVFYLIGSQLRFRSSIAATVAQLVPGSIVTDFDADRATVETTRGLRVSTSSRPLSPFDSEAAARSILSAMTHLNGHELLVVQVTLGQRRTPLPPPADTHRSDQSVASLLLRGRQPDPRSDSRRALIAKLGQHGFAATVRLGVTAGSADRRRSLLLSLASAMSTVEAPGVHLKLTTSKASALNQAAGTAWWRGTPQTLNVEEVSHLTAWPVNDRDEPLPGQPPRHPKPVRPAQLAMDGDRMVAMATAPGVEGQLGYTVTDSLRHSWILGPSGTGKSNLLLSLICQDLRAGRPLVVIEPKDLVTDILSRVPAERVDDIVVLDPFDDEPVGINPLMHTSGRNADIVADSIFGVFHSLYGDTLGPRSSDILRNCLDVLAARDDASLVMLPLLLTNPSFRRATTARAMQDDPYAAGPFWAWFDSLSPDAAARVVGPLSNKIRPLLGRSMRAVLAQRRPRFNVRQVLSDKKVLLVPLQKGALGPKAAQLLGALVVAELWQAIRERVSFPESERDPVMVYIDEVQDYLHLPTDLGDALATARSLGAGFHLAHQFREQLPPSMRAAFDANARSRIAFQLGAPDARAMAAGQGVLKPEDFSSLPAFHVYAQLLRGNSVQPWASGVTAPPPPICSNPADIRARSRHHYGQPRAEIEESFAELLHAEESIAAPSRRRRTRIPTTDTAMAGAEGEREGEAE